jgi:phosphatidylethanolamine/phosphatidyl-N-methylethanolamine N-methyltransferase
VRYSLFAPFYGALVQFRRARRRSVEGLALGGDERVVMPGAGPGPDLAFLPEGVRVVAGDLAPAMTRRLAKAAAASPHASRTTVVELDAQRLPLPDGWADVVLLHLIVAVVPDGRACLAEAARVVRPGGRVVILDKFAPDGRPVSWVRRLLNPLVESVATSVDRRLADLLEGLPLSVEAREPAALGGFFEHVRLVRHPDEADPPGPGGDVLTDPAEG